MYVAKSKLLIDLMSGFRGPKSGHVVNIECVDCFQLLWAGNAEQVGFDEARASFLVTSGALIV